MRTLVLIASAGWAMACAPCPTPSPSAPTPSTQQAQLASAAGPAGAAPAAAPATPAAPAGSATPVAAATKAGFPRPTFYVDGAVLKDPCGKPVVMRGVNAGAAFPYDVMATKASEIAKTGANAVRITFREGHEGASSSTPAVMARWIEASVANGMLPIPGNWDGTGQWVEGGDNSKPAMIRRWRGQMKQMLRYWLNPAMLAVLKQNQDRMILNVANEGPDDIPQDIYRAVYTEAIQQLRAAGLNMPLMIDAGQGGREVHYLIDNGKYLLDKDPQRNLVFGWHPYMARKPHSYYDVPLDKAKKLGICLVIGEFAKIGPDPHPPWKWNAPIDWKYIMRTCEKRRVGWLWWWWGSSYETDKPDFNSLVKRGNFDTPTKLGREVLGYKYSISKTSKPIPYFRKFSCGR